MPLPKTMAPVLFGAFQCAFTTGIATALATLRQIGLSTAAIWPWLSTWALSWAMLLPLVIALAPVLQKLVSNLVSDDT